jgi:hypothetical protein
MKPLLARINKRRVERMTEFAMKQKEKIFDVQRLAADYAQKYKRFWKPRMFISFLLKNQGTLAEKLEYLSMSLDPSFPVAVRR